VNLPGREPVVDAVAYSGAAATQRRRRLARVRLAELVAMRRAARPSGGPEPVHRPHAASGATNPAAE
jgi:hypothetical protein